MRIDLKKWMQHKPSTAETLKFKEMMTYHKLIRLDNDAVRFMYKDQEYLIPHADLREVQVLDRKFPSFNQADYYEALIDYFDRGLALLWLWKHKVENA
jgi:hypothetical protein